MKILSMVQSGKFGSIDDAIEAALTSYEGKGLSARDSARSRAPPISDESASRLPRDLPKSKKLMPSMADFDGSHIRFTEPLDQSRLTSKLMPITFQKFLPLKVALTESVIYLRDHENEDVLLRQLWAHVGPQAVSWGAALDEMDILLNRPRGERLSVSFPKQGDKSGKSMVRYLDSVFGTLLQDGRQSGVLPFLGFAKLTNANGEASFGITKEGLEFATLRNPVLSDGEYMFPPFSIQERDFLLDQISRRCPTEADHMRHYLVVLHQHPGISRTEANRYMRGFYERIWNPLELSSSLVDSLRGGVNSRCYELGLAKTTREGVSAYYGATDLGLQWLGANEETEQ